MIHFFVIPDFTAKFCPLTSQFLTSISRICGNAASPIVEEDVIKEHFSQLYPKTGKTTLPFKKGNWNLDDMVNYRLVCKRQNLLFTTCVLKSGPH